MELLITETGTNPLADASIAILVLRKSLIAPLLAILRHKGLPARGEGGSLLSDDMAVCVVLSLLHPIDHPSDTAAVFHVANSPLGQALGFVEKMEIADVLEKVTSLRADIYDAGLARRSTGGWVVARRRAMHEFSEDSVNWWN